MEARSQGMDQQLKVHSAECVEACRGQLTSLDVRRCQASREEDKEAILSKIADIPEFNSFLRNLLLDEQVGLLAESHANMEFKNSFIFSPSRISQGFFRIVGSVKCLISRQLF